MIDQQHYHVRWVKRQLHAFLSWYDKTGVRETEEVVAKRLDTLHRTLFRFMSAFNVVGKGSLMCRIVRHASVGVGPIALDDESKPVYHVVLSYHLLRTKETPYGHLYYQYGGLTHQQYDLSMYISLLRTWVGMDIHCYYHSPNEYKRLLPWWVRWVHPWFKGLMTKKLLRTYVIYRADEYQFCVDGVALSNNVYRHTVQDRLRFDRGVQSPLPRYRFTLNNVLVTPSPTRRIKPIVNTPYSTTIVFNSSLLFNGIIKPKITINDGDTMTILTELQGQTIVGDYTLTLIDKTNRYH